MTNAQQIPMIAPTMAEVLLPTTVDALQMVNENRNLQGIINSANLPRVAQSVVSIESPLAVSMTFSKEPQGNLLLTGQCQMQVSVLCERCLEVMQIQLANQFAFALVFADEQAKNLSKELEPVLLDGFAQLNLYELLEDEALLCLPAVPKHENEDCSNALVALKQTATELKKENPFSVLSQLK